MGGPADAILQVNHLPAGRIPKIKDATCNFSSTEEGTMSLFRVRMGCKPLWPPRLRIIALRYDPLQRLPAAI